MQRWRACLCPLLLCVLGSGCTPPPPYHGLLLVPPKLMPGWDWQNPAYDGQFQPHGCLLPLGHAFHIYQGPAAHQELLFKGM